MKSTLREAMTYTGLSATELSKLTGICKSSISAYLSGKQVPRGERLKALEQALGIELLDIKDVSPKKLTTDMVGRLLHKSGEVIRAGLRQGVFPWGYAVDLGGGRFSYIINDSKF